MSWIEELVQSIRRAGRVISTAGGIRTFRGAGPHAAEDALKEGLHQQQAAGDDGDVDFQHGPDGFEGAGRGQVSDDEFAEFDQTEKTEDADSVHR